MFKVCGRGAWDHHRIARGGGGGALTPNFGRYVPRQGEKWGLRIELQRKNAGLRSELRELERENAGLWSELGELGRENASLRNGLKDTSGWHSVRPLTPERRGKVNKSPGGLNAHLN